MKLFVALAATGVFMFLSMLYFATSWIDAEQAYENVNAQLAQSDAALAQARKALFDAAIKVQECADEQ